MLVLHDILKIILIILLISIQWALMYLLGNILLWNTGLIDKVNDFYLYHSSFKEYGLYAIVNSLILGGVYFLSKFIFHLKAVRQKFVASTAGLAILFLFLIILNPYFDGTIDLRGIKNIVCSILSAIFLVALDEKL